MKPENRCSLLMYKVSGSIRRLTFSWFSLVILTAVSFHGIPNPVSTVTVPFDASETFSKTIDSK
jgi:hypothetical protein